MKIMADRVPIFRGRGIEIRMLDDEPGRTPCYVGLPTLHPIDSGMEIPPAFKLNEKEAQELCDSLWEAGIRPSNGAGSVGQLAATQAHLADMKKLAFHALRVPYPTVDGGGTL